MSMTAVALYDEDNTGFEIDTITAPGFLDAVGWNLPPLRAMGVGQAEACSSARPAPAVFAGVVAVEQPSGPGRTLDRSAARSI